tara:strand:- start:10 stop:387 length:378 start_codon:yes stop_codon:yes gene_type:complete
MGCCFGKETKSDDEYIREIFDGLDIDGTQSLDENEIITIWNKAKKQKLQTLRNELNTFVTNKNKEIEDTELLTAASLLENGDSMTLQKFKPLIKSLNMEGDELHQLWISTKRNEIKQIQNMLDKE